MRRLSVVPGLPDDVVTVLSREAPDLGEARPGPADSVIAAQQRSPGWIIGSVSAFPWSNLITAAATLGAGLGTVGLKGRSDRKDRAAQADREDDSARAERLRLAYADLVTTATEMVRNLRQILEVAKEVTPRHPAFKEIAGRAEALAGQLAQAIAVVQMAGSDKARQGARIVYNTTAAAVRVIEQDPLDRGAAEAATDELFAAIDTFIDAVRPETTAIAPQARPPRPARRWWRRQSR